jgi:uncharacterized Zn-binding protein involved in type VI secretion
MPEAARVGVDAAGGIIIGPGAPTVTVNGSPIANEGDAVTPHGSGPHNGSPVLVPGAGSPTVTAQGEKVFRKGDPATCGHAVATGSANVIVGNASIPANPYEFSHAADVVAAAGRDAPIDDTADDPASQAIIAAYPADSQAPIEPPVTDDQTAAPAEPATTPPSCGDITVVDYNYPLGSNFILADLTIGTWVNNVTKGCYFRHKVRAQAGYTEPEIICNLKALAENVLDPLFDQYPSNFRINSGFRTFTTGRSQHEKGMAADIQWAGLSNAAYLTRAQWVRDNLPYDQLIMEHGNSIWLHISFNRLSTQRMQVLTMKNSSYVSGLKLYYA